MLFAVLIGLVSALVWLLRGWFLKIRFFFGSGKKQVPQENVRQFVIFSDDKRYWSVFRPVCREFDRRGIDVFYLTASPDDPALENGFEHIHAEFIGKGNRAFAKLNFLKADIVLSTTPGLDVYQWKRSKDVKCYVHMLHAAAEVAGYRMFGIDYYDALLLSGEYQIRDTRALEKLRGLPEKELVLVGIPYMDDMLERLKNSRPQNADPQASKQRTILLAPSWGESAIFSRYGEKIFDALLQTGYHIIVRPHPQSFTSEKELVDRLMAEYPDSDRLEWNRDNDNFDALNRADLLISDFSGVIFDFTLVYDKPVIYADTQFDKSPYDAWWLDTPYWTFTALPRIGEKLTPDTLPDLQDMIEACLTDEKYASGRDEVRRETWVYPGEGAKRAVDWLVEKQRSLTAETRED